ncbi:MAG TPA: tRNA (pseudouridine(54)-N(1))-methyltransferase TrmY [Candidatus Nanoarchaeia archaeon]|nr:tRNA (pseudouridine(54)-N(1))-methyltransferase TrmY [Candidatus Nanoarchaeia archaeon]
MREFIYYSRVAPTAGNMIKDDLQAGRVDIAIHVVIASFFLSHKIRTDTRLHMVFAGPPDPPKHLELFPVTEGTAGIDKIYINKKNVAGILKRMLYKYKEGKKNEVFPGYWVEKKGFLELVKELHASGRSLYLLDAQGEDIRTADIKANPIFILGDHLGLPAKEFKRLKGMCTPVTIGKRTYFASQTVAVVNNELDRREDYGFLPQSPPAEINE